MTGSNAIPRGCLALFAAAALGCERSAPQGSGAAAGRAREAVEVTAAPVETREIQRRIAAVGTLDAFESFTIAPKVEGRVKAVRADVGDRVPADAVLVEIDPTEFELAVEEAERSLEKELAKLGRDQPPGEGFDLLSLPAVVRGRLLKENAAQRYERQKEMLAKNATAKEAFEQAETDLKVAEAALKTTVLEAEETLAAVRHQQAVLALARQRLVETQVRAPSLAPGESKGPLEYAVAKRLVSVGEMTRPTSPVFGLVLDHALKLRPKLPERYVSGIRSGQRAEIRLEAYPERVFEGQVSRIHPTVDPVSRTFEIEVLVPNQERLLKAGSFAKAEILTRVDARAIVVPVEALVTYAGVDKVFQVRAGKAHEVKVALGEQGRGWLELVGPLEPGSLVVTSGQSQLADGTPVRLRERGPAAAAEEGLEKTGEGAADR